MSIRVLDTALFLLNMRTRMPFRYGITTLTALPHLFFQATVEIDGRRQTGVAADHLPPKWFTKNPDTTPQQDIAGLLGPYDAMVQALTPKVIQDAAKKVFDMNNYARFVLLPEGKTTP